MMQNIAVGLVIADSYEFVPFLEYARRHGAKQGMFFGNQSAEMSLFGQGVTLTCIKCGNGKVNAAMAAAALIAENGVDIMLNIGLSGAVYGVGRGETVAGSSYVECDFDLTSLGYDLGVKPEQEYIYSADERLLEIACEKMGLETCGFGTGDFFLTSDQMREKYRRVFGIGAFDMESAAVAAVCRKAGVPFLSIRKISDDSEDSAASDYREMNLRREQTLTELLDELLRHLCYADD